MDITFKKLNPNNSLPIVEDTAVFSLLKEINLATSIEELREKVGERYKYLSNEVDKRRIREEYNTKLQILTTINEVKELFSALKVLYYVKDE